MRANLRLQTLQARKILLQFAELDLKIDDLSRFFLKGLEQSVFSSLTGLLGYCVRHWSLLIHNLALAFVFRLLFGKDLVNALLLRLLGLDKLLRLL